MLTVNLGLYPCAAAPFAARSLWHTLTAPLPAAGATVVAVNDTIIGLIAKATIALSAR
jgi:hypothetical protein